MKFTKRYVDVVIRMCGGEADKLDTIQWLRKMLKIAWMNKEITDEHYNKMYLYIMNR